MAEEKCAFASLAKREGTNPAQVLFKVTPPSAAARLPGDVCIVVDVSGSMQLEATITGGREREAGVAPLAVLDIVKHAVKTVIHTLKNGDRIGIVSYSDNAKVVLPLTVMSEAGRSAAETAVESLMPDGQTNLWAGLKAGLDLLAEGAKPNTSSNLMILTDGVPNVEPAGGHLEALAAYRRAAPSGKLPCTVHTFGFGTDLDSKLLNGIACAGDGMYVFIPDAGMVGTALVNCMSNSLVTMGRNAIISVEPSAGCQIASCKGYSLSAGSISLGSLQFGQSKDALIHVIAPDGHAGPFASAKLCYDGPGGAQEIQLTCQTLTTEAGSLAEIAVQELRLGFAELALAIIEAIGPTGENLAQVKELIDGFSDKLTHDDERIKGLKEDIEGQVREATSRTDWWCNWGLHYLQSLARAHLTQQCNNFKDPGVQLYGGDLFNDLRDEADEVFVKLPPPKVGEMEKINTLIAMGFDEATARNCLTAAHDNLELAAGYCMEGIPARPPPAARAPAAARAAPAYDMRDYHDRGGG